MDIIHKTFVLKAEIVADCIDYHFCFGEYMHITNLVNFTIILKYHFRIVNLIHFLIPYTRKIRGECRGLCQHTCPYFPVRLVIFRSTVYIFYHYRMDTAHYVQLFSHCGLYRISSVPDTIPYDALLSRYRPTVADYKASQP